MQAIRAVACYNGSNPPDTFNYTVNGHVCTFHLVKNSYDNSGTLNTNSTIDLNKDAGGDYIYLFYGSTASEVDTTELRTAYDSAQQN